jgi:hypothetical protein
MESAREAIPAAKAILRIKAGLQGSSGRPVCDNASLKSTLCLLGVIISRIGPQSGSVDCSM